jgi:hypothetical protein
LTYREWPWCAIVLYLPKNGPGTIEEIVIKFGGKRTRRNDSGRLLVEWRDLMPKASLEERAEHRLLRLDMSRNALYEHIARDDGQEVAEAFRDGCEALKPDVAMFLSWTFQADPEWIDPQYRAILTYDANELVDARVGVLYLGAELARFVTAPEVRIADRARLPVSEGLLVFANRPPRRWA